MAGLLKRALDPSATSAGGNERGSTVAAIRHPIITDQSQQGGNQSPATPATTTTSSTLESSSDYIPANSQQDKESAKMNREIQAIQQDRKRRIDLAKQAAQEPEHIRSRYGPILPNQDLNQTLDAIEPGYTQDLITFQPPENGSLASISTEHIGKRVAFTARIHTSRPLSSRLVFFLFRHQIDTIQGVLHFEQDRISTHMVKWAERLPSESIVHITGNVQAPRDSSNHSKVHSATIQDVEIRVESIHVLTRAKDLRFHVYSAEISAKAHAQRIKEERQQDAIGDGITKHEDEDGEDDDYAQDDNEDEEDDDVPDMQSRSISVADSSRSTTTTITSSSRSKSIQHISLRTRLANRIIDLRTPATLSIFRLQSALCTAFRAYLSDEKRAFLEIHTPKLQAGATESGSEVSRVDYFGRTAFLAQSPQLAKQMAISGDFGRVYEIGPVFRAENSNTHRHLTEYTGLDIEMTINRDYHEVMHMIDNTLKYMFTHIYTTHRRELDVVQASFPHEDLVWLEETPVLRFDQAVKMLTDSGWTDTDGRPLKEDEDLGTRDEIRLGQLVKEKHKTDYYIIDKFPASARPFYAMPDKDDPKWTNSFDFFLRGQEILTGGQRIHQLKKLEKAMERNGVEPSDMAEYCEAFQFGAPPHGGAGIGLERLLMLLLQLGDIRNASLFPRDPQSLPAKPPKTSLRYPEASTLHPPWQRAAVENEDPIAEFDEELDEDEVEGMVRQGDGLESAAAAAGGTNDTSQQTKMLGQLQPLGKLIANFGQSTSTALFDDRYRIWRHAETGAAVSYVPIEKYAIIVGNPLCDDSQYPRVMRHFLAWLERETRLRPIWILVDGTVEKILGEQYGWCTLSCVAEERASTLTNPSFHDAEVQRRVRHAEREGVTIFDIPMGGEEIPADVVRECEEGMRIWLGGRKGKQAHLTQLNPWRDREHRFYSFARDASGRIVAMVVLAMLSKAQGYQVKYALDWDGAPSGTIEAITLHAIKAAASLGAQTITFGAGATPAIEAGHNIGKLHTAALRRTYKSIMASRGLARKTAFRAKMGADDSAPGDRLWIAYPKGGLGARGIKALLAFCGDPKDEGSSEEDEEEEGDLESGTGTKFPLALGIGKRKTTRDERTEMDGSQRQLQAEKEVSKKLEDEASGKKQIVHSTQSASAPGAGVEKEDTKDEGDVTSDKARRRSAASGNGGGKKRLSGLLNSVFHRQHGHGHGHGHGPTHGGERTTAA
ncbi:unnamed protein product [Tilletia controversa]|nr:hypothetical protein CF328_g1587 [Tilletia controversa]CAD6974506.1 unnamed protein product [Tilletia controversa]